MIIPDGYTRETLLDCVDREIRYRERVYPRLIASGRMSVELAAEQLRAMRAVRACLASIPKTLPLQLGLQIQKGHT